ncbi:ABC transporter ATP-binding protein [Candidatus Bathycorpusculum sp.]|jgi:putative ABC transport system ATP-binding protein|uniref:ABC transporter ATP-binding protein n=1 Tax=Candidatus Bathycorpusculum sp. TaxID=2994959 RepID=UPI002836BF6F|nr:ABC transporter ATP-binding protein [Candidatus Termitimicrobium sp.]MCL2431707.1 ABC transporter ATP-binding protein [Candidatus Termitimicrobium sp.]MDR0470582.1 ABC transporter ATP-binding protein [Nitrososphaerota archaeon]
MAVSEENRWMVLTQNLSKTYLVDTGKVEVLKDLTIAIPKATFAVLCGPSGSGKTTLLNIISGIDRPSSGELFVAGQPLVGQNEDFLSDFRCSHVGFVFQAYNLVSTLTVAENIAFPMEWQRKPPSEIEERTLELIRMVGLEHRETHFPAQLSGGEQQRVAFARALANDPELILADEPTGNLDVKNAEKILQVLHLLKENGKTVLVSTHDLQIRALADQVIALKDGQLASPDE